MVQVYHELLMIYSHSQIQTYMTCPLRYRYEKIDMLEVSGGYTVPLLLGSAVHSVLEKLYAYRTKNVISSKEEVLKWFDEIRERDVSEAAAEQNEGFEALDISRAHTRGKKYIRRYYNTYFPFDQAKTEGVEKNIIIKISQDIGFRGIIDRLDLHDDGTVTIIDYKTSRTLPESDDHPVIDQLVLYGAGILQNPTYKITRIIAKVVFLHFEKEHIFEITKESIGRLTKKYTNVVQEIEAKRFALNMGDQNAFEPTPGKYCENCPFMSICPAWAGKIPDALI